MGKRAYKEPARANILIDQLKLRLYEGQRVRLFEDVSDYGVNPVGSVKTQYAARLYTITQFFTNHILLTSASGLYRRSITYYDFLLWGTAL